MNRRQFNTMLAALPVTYSLPAPLSAAAAPQSATVPAGTYAWAQLIARAQNRCSAEMLARQLRLGTDAAQQLFDEMLRDGVLRAPGAAGIAQAVQPIDAMGASNGGTLSRAAQELRDLLPQAETDDTPPPLAKDAEPCLGCDDASEEEPVNARTDQPVQESPRRG